MQTQIKGGALCNIDNEGWPIEGNPYQLGIDQRAVIIDTSWDNRGRNTIITGPATITKEMPGSPEYLSKYLVIGGIVVTAKQIQGGNWVPDE